jgi:6-pyruvoyltetrahydropterin/6-carboxytetrahydropterin synthase
MKYRSTKVIELGSCAFRQWRATHSHCSKVHGYQLKAKFIFSSDELDDKGWVVDFGGLKELKASLQDVFDHKMCVASDDPHLSHFETLHSLGSIDMVVFEDGVGIEKTAKYCFEAAAKFILQKYGDRCKVESVEVFEHADNSAIYAGVSITAPKIDTDSVYKAVELLEPELSQVTSTEPSIQQRGANVGSNTTSGMSGLFGGTTWG